MRLKESCYQPANEILVTNFNARYSNKNDRKGSFLSCQNIQQLVRGLVSSLAKTFTAKPVTFRKSHQAKYIQESNSAQHRRQILIGWQRNHHRRIPTNNVARIRSKASRSVFWWQKLHFLCEETDNTQFRIIEKYFASMFRGLQFTIPEGTISISCVDQKLLTLQTIHYFL